MNMEEKILQIPIEKIIPNRFQPRLTFDDNALQELAQSIKEHGIIQPLVLRNLGDKYEIIAGERRFKASQMAGLKTVPAVISDIDDKKSAEVALVENIQRKNLTSIEEAKSYKNILDQGYLTQEQLAEKLGISQATVANKLRLLNLADEVQDALLKEKISERHARSLLVIKDKDEQVKWLNRILNERLTVRQLDIELKKELKNEDEEVEDIPLVNLTPNINEIKENASDINPQQGLHDVESMLKPTPETASLFNLSNPVEEVETLDFDDNVQEHINNNVSQNNSVDDKIPNKFFNFLEDEGANMNEENSIDEIFYNNNTNNINSVETLMDDTSTETLDDNLNNTILSTEDNNITNNTILPTNDSLSEVNNENTNNNIFISDETPITDANIVDTSNITNNLMDDSMNIVEAPVNQSSNKFFNFGDNEIVEDNNSLNHTPIVEDNTNNIIEEQPVEDDTNIIDNNVIEMNEEPKDNDIFDPMSMVNTLEDDYQEKVEEEQGIDLKTAINTIRDTKENLESKGFNIFMDEADLGNSYTITITINKEDN